MEMNPQMRQLMENNGQVDEQLDYWDMNNGIRGIAVKMNTVEHPEGVVNLLLKPHHIRESGAGPVAPHHLAEIGKEALFGVKEL